MTDLTPTQRKVLNVIAQHQENFGTGTCPSMQQIANALERKGDGRSKSTVFVAMKELERKGYLEVTEPTEKYVRIV